MAEGTKRKRNAVEFVNSDPKMILLASRWIGKLTDRKVEYRIQYHADQDLLELQQYWGKLLNVSPDTIRLQRKSNSGQLEGRKFRSVYGVMTVRISDTYFRARLEAWMDFIKSQW